MEKGVKQGKSSYPLLSMKKDQANKTNVERVYRWQPLAWEPGLNRSSIDPQLVQGWAWCSCISCTSMLQSWSGVEVDEAEWRWMEQSGGGWGRRCPGVGREGEGRSYHDISLWVVGGGRSQLNSKESCDLMGEVGYKGGSAITDHFLWKSMMVL